MDSTNANGALGGGIGKLLLRNLPSNYTYNSIYGLFPFYTPKTMSSALQGLGLASQYALARPMKTPNAVSVDTFAGVTAVLKDYRTFNVVYEDAIRSLTNGYGCVSWVFFMQRATDLSSDSSWAGMTIRDTPSIANSSVFWAHMRHGLFADLLSLL